jgi:hypothetical protein
MSPTKDHNFIRLLGRDLNIGLQLKNELKTNDTPGEHLTELRGKLLC